MPLTLDVFNTDPFNIIDLSMQLERIPYSPQLIGSFNMFRPNPVMTETVAIEERDHALTLIPVSRRGEPLQQQQSRKATVRSFSTYRLAKGDAITAGELQNYRRFGTVTEMDQLQNKIAEKQEYLMQDLEFTKEWHRYGAVTGKVLDSDGTTTVIDWYSEFGITEASAIDFDLDNGSPASGALWQKFADMRRAMLRALKIGNASYPLQVVGLADDTWFDAFMKHNDVFTSASDKSHSGDMSAATRMERALEFGSYSFGGTTIYNYRSTDNIADSPAANKKLQIPAGTCKFFPVNVPGLFQVAYSPGESLDVVNTPGLPQYFDIIPDLQRNQFAELELYSYPLYVCTRPEVLRKATLT